MKIEHTQDVELLVPLLEEWKCEQNGGVMGIDTDTETNLNDTASWLQTCGGTIITASVKGVMVGFLVLVTVPSEFGDQKWAVEKGWYMRPHVHYGGPLLFKEAQAWARSHGCSHLVMVASNMASDIHDRVCRFYEIMKMQKFETSYIKELV
jgi:hypothetical protein